MAVGHEAITKGGWLGYLLRRAIHIGMVFIPWIYYHFTIPAIALWIALFLIVFIEVIRLTTGLQFFGHVSNRKESQKDAYQKESKENCRPVT